MPLALALLLSGLALRLPDRLHFARGRPRTAPLGRLMEHQRIRANNWTPVLLPLGQWVQIAGWWVLISAGPLWAAAPAALAVGAQFRHLQEISHFAVHGALTRSARLGDRLAELAAHHPLGLGPLAARRDRHVRDHHPNATVDGADPNLAELRAAGLQPGATRRRFAIAAVHPLTPRGLAVTLTGLATATLPPTRGWAVRTAILAAVPAAAYLLGGWPAVVLGVLIPRLLIYPQLSWLSLLVEHTWFDPDPRTGPRPWVEAGRCLRLYPRNRLLSALAATTWLPYGDLHHYAHSAHPSIRWTHLPALERHLGHPHFTPPALLLGPNSITTRHHRALAAALTVRRSCRTGAGAARGRP